MAQDRFANVIAVNLAASAANTLTFTEINLGISLGQRLGIVLDEVYYFPVLAGLQEMTADGDQIFCGFTSSQSVTNLGDYTDRRVLDVLALSRHDFGTAASGAHLVRPIKREWSPPLIYAGPSIFFAVNSTGLASALTVQARLHFRYQQLTQDEYIELAEAFLVSS